MAHNSNEENSEEVPFSYVLYLYREELRKPDRSWMSRVRSKFQLTHELITRTIVNIHNCSEEDLMALARETEFNRRLYLEMTRLNYQENMQMWKVHQEQEKLQILHVDKESQAHQQQSQKRNLKQLQDQQEDDDQPSAKRHCSNDIRTTFTTRTST